MSYVHANVLQIHDAIILFKCIDMVVCVFMVLFAAFGWAVGVGFWNAGLAKIVCFHDFIFSH